MHGVSESMAGRAAILSLYPLSTRETSKVTLLRGGYPEVIARPSASRLWFASYLQTYLERDVRAITAVKDLATFRRFMALVASRHGQVQNKTELAAPLGVSVPTVTQWLNVLETTAQIRRPAFLRELRQAPDQVAEGLLRGLRARLPSARRRERYRAEQVTFPRSAVRGVHRRRDRQSSGQCGKETRDLLLSGRARPRGRLLVPGPPRHDPTRRVQSGAHRHARHGETDGALGRSHATPTHRRRRVSRVLAAEERSGNPGGRTWRSRRAVARLRSGAGEVKDEATVIVARVPGLPSPQLHEHGGGPHVRLQLHARQRLVPVPEHGVPLL